MSMLRTISELLFEKHYEYPTVAHKAGSISIPPSAGYHGIITLNHL